MARRPSRIGRWSAIALGWTLLVASLPIGLLPGPGGIFVFAAGAALLLRHARGAKRLYVRAGRRWPRLRAVLDRALRRRRRPAATPH